jgi:hypothetical protein
MGTLQDHTSFGMLPLVESSQAEEECFRRKACALVLHKGENVKAYMQTGHM